MVVRVVYEVNEHRCVGARLAMQNICICHVNIQSLVVVKYLRKINDVSQSVNQL